ncbi:YfhD family protein [Fictibacillus aquaticus]|uniref:YfhD family protein n=1 Tax=Fictibacillus aquaticus TaxID=2021314 RepID=UPI0026AA2382
MEKRNRKSQQNAQARASQANSSLGVDVEYSRELADQDDLEAQARAQAADSRQKKARR